MFDIHFHRRNLPHLYIPERSYFITFRLKGSLPINKIFELRNILKLKYKALSKSEVYNINKKFFAEYDKTLDSSKYGPRFLTNNKIISIITDSFKYYDKKDYELVCLCIMPNHVHALFTLIEKSRPLNKIMQSIKRHTALQINKCLSKHASVWQSESYDHIIRDDDEYYNIIRYILNNPQKAGLADDWLDWKGIFISDELREMML